MTKINEIYKCDLCGNVVEMVHTGAGELVCCGQPMKLQVEKTQDEGSEKHVPVVAEGEGCKTIKVGSVPHPMEEDHYIEWIEVIADDRTVRKTLKPGDKPEKKFCLTGKVRAYCNLHGLWVA
jgi:superoxide reductase